MNRPSYPRSMVCSTTKTSIQHVGYRWYLWPRDNSL